MEAVFLHRVGFLEYFCPKQGQDFKPLAAPPYQNMGQVPPGVQTNLNDHSLPKNTNNCKKMFQNVQEAAWPSGLGR